MSKVTADRVEAVFLIAILLAIVVFVALALAAERRLNQARADLHEQLLLALLRDRAGGDEHRR